METLTLRTLSTLNTALEKFCKAMPHLTKLSMPCMFLTNSYDGVLRAIAANMPHLKYLDITNCTVEPKVIENLLPTEDNPLGGCPHLVYLNLHNVRSVDVALLKKIILALPKLRSLKHKLLIDALGDFTEEEMSEDTGRSLNSLFVRCVNSMSINSDCHLRYDNLAKSPAFQRFNNNITTVDIRVASDDKGPKESASLACVLKSMPNLKHITLSDISDTHKNVLPLLESTGNLVQYLSLFYFSGNLSLHNIMKTCKNLVQLSLSYNTLGNDSKIHHDQGQNPNQHPVLYYLTEITLHGLYTGICSGDMLTALLQSPNLKKINLENLEAMTDDVMFNVLSSRDCTALSKVTQFSMEDCPLVTAVPFVKWLNREDCSLQHMRFYDCEKIDYKSLKAAVEKCPRALTIEAQHFFICK